MSFLAILNINSDIKDVRLLNVEYEFSQPVDHALRPKGKVQPGLITLEVESDNKTAFAQWMLSDTMQHSGEIVFTKRDSGASLKTVSFKDAYCIYYKETFNASNDSPMSIIIKISAKEVNINSVKIENAWPQKSGGGSSQASSPPANEPIRSFNPLN
ncbi:type VI secretion system tube protein TssD [Polluticaenibacter yanchengensis]|uniref:Type VI secretion system tube protein TssD n=1 Tax=Polluticaenibacter yanchengensis TaxID=3014562 RepID=A0ABT4UFV5_9BACT|nr:type VI secretion system tube protein TssD [Chitinophagaceae bacterium LY-5]